MTEEIAKRVEALASRLETSARAKKQIDGAATGRELRALASEIRKSSEARAPLGE